MPRFHFEIINGVRIEDPVGLECKSEDQARQVAGDIARQIAIDVGTEPARQVVVVDDEGLEIHKVAVNEAKPTN
jgi:hypothetical protein